MSMKIEHEGVETEVYTADELAAARQSVTDELTPKITAAEGEKTRLEGLLKDRADEFKGFRKLSDDQVAALDVAQRTIYENGLALQAEREKSANLEKERKVSAIAAAIRARVGTDENLFKKVSDAYQIVQLVDETPEQLEARVAAALGVLGSQEPDLLAQISGFGGGNSLPIVPKPKQGDAGYGDTDAGKAAAKELGLLIEPPKTT